MDTVDLSEETYKTILGTAEGFHHDLTIQFGVLAYKCKNDDDYLNNSKKLIIEWQKDLEYSVNVIFFDKPPTIDELNEVLEKLKSKIDQTLQRPIAKRKFIEW